MNIISSSKLLRPKEVRASELFTRRTELTKRQNSATEVVFNTVNKELYSKPNLKKNGKSVPDKEAADIQSQLEAENQPLPLSALEAGTQENNDLNSIILIHSPSIVVNIKQQN
jgi:hypothetical protein